MKQRSLSQLGQIFLIRFSMLFTLASIIGDTLPLFSERSASARYLLALSAASVSMLALFLLPPRPNPAA